MSGFHIQHQLSNLFHAKLCNDLAILCHMPLETSIENSPMQSMRHIFKHELTPLQLCSLNTGNGLQNQTETVLQTIKDDCQSEQLPESEELSVQITGTTCVASAVWSTAIRSDTHSYRVHSATMVCCQKTSAVS